MPVTPSAFQWIFVLRWPLLMELAKNTRCWSPVNTTISPKRPPAQGFWAANRVGIVKFTWSMPASDPVAEFGVEVTTSLAAVLGASVRDAVGASAQAARARAE